MKKTTKKRRKASAKKSSGTERWPSACMKPGQWFKVPKSLFQRTSEFHENFKPHHLWLILALQADRYKDRPPRHYWEQLAGWAGVSSNTVRRWGYELKKMGLLTIEQNRKLNPGEKARAGHRNERNEFHLLPFELKTLTVHQQWESERGSAGKSQQ